MVITGTDNNTNTSSNNKGEKKKYDGYLNLKLKDKHGNPHTISCFIGLNKEDAVHRALLNNAEDGAREFEIIGYVNVAKDQSVEIEL